MAIGAAITLGRLAISRDGCPATALVADNTAGARLTDPKKGRQVASRPHVPGRFVGPTEIAVPQEERRGLRSHPFEGGRLSRQDRLSCHILRRSALAASRATAAYERQSLPTYCCRLLRAGSDKYGVGMAAVRRAPSPVSGSRSGSICFILEAARQTQYARHRPLPSGCRSVVHSGLIAAGLGRGSTVSPRGDGQSVACRARPEPVYAGRQQSWRSDLAWASRPSRGPKPRTVRLALRAQSDGYPACS